MAELVMSRLGQEATSLPAQAQPTAADAGGLVQKILDAARTVRRDKFRCMQLANQVLKVGDMLAKLDSMGVIQDPRVAIVLDGLDDTLRQAYELVVSCQCPESATDRCFSFALGSRARAKQFRMVHEEMGDYLRLDPSIVSHVDQTRLRLQEHLLSWDNEAHAPSFNTQGDPAVVDMWWRSCWPRKEKQTPLSIPRYNYHERPGFSVFHLSQLAVATKNFSPQNEIGHGGFGTVYKGQINDRLMVAVKRCSPSGLNGDLDKLSEEFRTEVDLLVKLNHKNIVKLIGCCTDEREMILVYEYMPNGSLDKFIYGMRRELVLDWPTRFHIIKGIAQGLIYLHEHCGSPMVHRDIKSSNILLDLDMNPKITDFGTARVVPAGAGEESTDILLGTIGYLAPEYVTERIYSSKSDIYSFGVVLIEIIAGKRRVFPEEGHSTYIHEYARELWTEGRSPELIDPLLLHREDHTDEIARCTQIGLLCIEQNPEDRPSMQDVLLMLSCDKASLRAPSTKFMTRMNLSDDSEASTAPLRGEISTYVEYGSDCLNNIMSETTDDR